MRAPSPVLMNPREMKKARTISQMTLLPKPLNESVTPSVPDAAVAQMPMKATAPMGSGFRMIPTIVATKIASRCIAAGSTPSGAGTNQSAHASTIGVKKVRAAGPRPRGVASELFFRPINVPNGFSHVWYCPPSSQLPWLEARITCGKVASKGRWFQIC